MLRQLPASALAASLLAAALIPLATPVVAADVPFVIETRRLVEVRSIEALPRDVKDLLGRQKTGVDGIADMLDKFNATDVIDTRLPTRRFITGGVGPGSALMAYEQGGRGYSIHAAAFSLERAGWVEVGEWTLNENPRSLRRLLQLVDSRHYPMPVFRALPLRREGPLREQNVSDEEIREIQAATHEIFPGAIVNISGVVTGCPCEEGSGCSDQVWVVAHREGRTEGLQLSRVNGHWGISVVQRWWINFDNVSALRITSPQTYRKALQDLYNTYPACLDKPTAATQAGVTR